MEDKIILPNGFEIPNLCFGTGIVCYYRNYNPGRAGAFRYWARNCLKDRRQLKLDMQFGRSVRTAYESGIRMFDTSRAYGGSEYELGRALRRYDRTEYRIITKLCNADQYKGNIRAAFERSLKELGTEYADIYLMHWPVTGIWTDSWREMEKIYEEGLCKAIGVCNCNIHHLEELKESANIRPMINEFECHPLFTQNELRAYCRKNCIQVMAYTSTARMDERLRKTRLMPIAEKHHAGAAQIMLKWHQQLGNIPIFASSDPKHIAVNAMLKDITLSEAEMEAISAININSRLRYDPDNCDFTKL